MCTTNKCCRKLGSILKTLIGFGVSIFIYWLVFQPHQVRVYMDTATLSNFNILSAAPPPFLSYSFNLTLSLRNPNRRVGVYYDRISADAFYNGSQLGVTDTNFDPFFQHTKNTTIVHPVFAGKDENLSKSVMDAFDKDKREGTYNVEVKLRFELRHKLWLVKLRFKPEIECRLRFPVMANGTASTAPFSKCNVDY